MKLTEKQKRFIQEYLIDLNATQAAIRSGYSQKTARSAGQRLLTNVDIQAEIEQSIKNVNKNVESKAEDVIRGLMRIAYSDIRKIATWTEDGIPQFMPSSDIDEDTAMSIKSITFTERHFGEGKVERKLKIEQCDKKGALDSLAKYHGLFIQKHEITGKDGGPIEFEQDPKIALLQKLMDMKKNLEAEG